MLVPEWKRRIGVRFRCQGYLQKRVVVKPNSFLFLERTFASLFSSTRGSKSVRISLAYIDEREKSKSDALTSLSGHVPLLDERSLLRIVPLSLLQFSLAFSQVSSLFSRGHGFKPR